MGSAKTCLWTAAACLQAGIAGAQLQLVAAAETPCVFAGEGRTIPATFHNPATNAVQADIRTLLLQASSATAAPLLEAAWKQLEVLPGQTVLESAPFSFPSVKAETTFIIRWQNGPELLGTTEVRVYPDNLLQTLKPLAQDTAIGVLDPQNQIKPLLQNARIDFADLARCGLEAFSGRLAIIGPFADATQMPTDIAKQARALAKRNTGVVWLQPPPGKHDQLRPSFYSVPAGAAAVIVAQPDQVAGLADDPRAQLRLVRFCELAVHPEPIRLPYLPDQP
jgi:hypothetical protein